MRLPFCFSLLAVIGMVQADVLEHWWNISYAIANPDGVSQPLSPSVTSAEYSLFFLALRASSHRSQRIMAVHPCSLHKI